MDTEAMHIVFERIFDRMIDSVSVGDFLRDHLEIFSCDSSSIRDNVRRSVGWLVGQQRVSKL